MNVFLSRAKSRTASRTARRALAVVTAATLLEAAWGVPGVLTPALAQTTSGGAGRGGVAAGTRPLTAAPPSAPGVVKSNVNVLILALDDVSAGDAVTFSALSPAQLGVAAPAPATASTAAVTGTMPATTGTIPGAVPGTAPLAAPVGGAITPASDALGSILAPASAGFSWIGAGDLPAAVPTWQILAKRTKPAPADDPFKLEPDRGVLYKAPGTQPAVGKNDKSGQGKSGQTGATSTLPQDGGFSVMGASPLPIAPALPALPSANPLLGPSTGTFTQRPPGAAQSAAAPLRRALMKAGFGDVAATPIDGALIQRAVGERRLTNRVLQSLQSAVAQLINASPVAATTGAAPGAATDDAGMVSATARSAVQATAQVGQALGYRAVVVLAVVPSTAATGTGGAATGGAATSGVHENYNLLVVDAAHETGEVMSFDQAGANELAANEAAAATGAAVVGKSVRAWPSVSSDEQGRKIENYMTSARALVDKGDTAGAQDQLNQVRWPWIRCEPMRC